jgi:hypothetical protein
VAVEFYGVKAGVLAENDDLQVTTPFGVAGEADAFA